MRLSTAVRRTLLWEEKMRSKLRDICVGLVLIYSPLVHSQPIAKIEGGRVTDVGPEAGTVYGTSQAFLIRGRDEAVASSGRAGLYKTTDGGNTWARSMSGLVDPATGVEPFIQGLCQSPSSPDIGYAVTFQDGIARTNDFGESWSPPTMTPNPLLSDCAVDPVDPAVVYAIVDNYDPARPGMLFKSSDGGQTFSTVGDGLPTVRTNLPLSVVVAPTNRNRIYAAAFAAAPLFASSDGGLTFEPLLNAPMGTWHIYPHPTADGTLLVTGDEDLFFLSTDGGASFTRVGAGLPPRFVGLLAFDSTDPSIIYATQGFATQRTNGFFRSEDGAQTFVRVDGLSEHELLGVGLNRVAVTPPSEKGAAIYVGSSLGPYRSDDGGKSFNPIHAGYRGTQVNDLAIDAAGRLLVATSRSAGVFRSTKDGTYESIGETIPFPFIIGVQAVAAAPDDPELYLAAASDLNPETTIFRTTDGGQSWSPAINTGFGSTVRIAFAPSDAARVYCHRPARLFRSFDGGQTFDSRTWQFVSRAFAVDPTNPDVIYAGGQGLFKSIDGGSTFQQVAPGDVVAIAIDPKHPQTVYAASPTTNAVIRSLDGGQTFSSMAVGGDRALGLGLDPSRPERVFAWMHAGGLFRSEDGGESWLGVDTDEARRRSTAQIGQTALVVAPDTPSRVYFGNGSVLQFVDD